MQVKRVFVALLLLAGSVGTSFGHDFWITGKAVDPQTKNLCCGENDCHLLPIASAHPTSGGYLLDDTGETIPWPRVQASPDGGIWACRWNSQTQCFFAPIPGA